MSVGKIGKLVQAEEASDVFLSDYSKPIKFETLDSRIEGLKLGILRLGRSQ